MEVPLSSLSIGSSLFHSSSQNGRASPGALSVPALAPTCRFYDACVQTRCYQKENGKLTHLSSILRMLVFLLIATATIYFQSPQTVAL